MTPREELEQLRNEQRIAELEAKEAAGKQRLDDANAFAAGGDVHALNPLMRGLGGAQHAFDRSAYGVKSLFTDLSDEDKAQLRRGKAFVDEGDTAAKVGEIGTDAGLLLAPGSGVTRGLRAATTVLPRALGALTRGAGEVAAGAGGGYIQAMPEERKQGAVAGGLGGAAGTVVNRVLGGAAKPLVTDDARALMREGVQPTVGQSIGGWANKIEEAAGSIPFVGSAVNRARQRATNEFNNRTIQIAAPGTHGIGDNAIAAARDAISEQYQHALGLMPRSFTVDAQPIIRSAIDAVDDPALALGRASKEHVLDYVEQHLLQRQSNITPDIAKRIESDLGQAVQRLVTSADGEQRAIGQALRRVQSDWRNSLTGIGNMNGTGAGDMLRQADAAWRAFIPIDTAASRVGAQGVEDAAGRYTPKMLRRAIEGADKSANNRVTRNSIGSTATPFNQLNTITRQGENVLSDRLADTGTATRLMIGGVGGTGALATGTAMAALPKALAVGALAHAGATRAGQAFATRGFEPALDALASMGIRGQQAAQLIEQYGPDAVLAMSRSVAPQTGAPYAPQQ